MDEPLRSSLRAARRRGLTSPDPVTAPSRPSGRPPATSPRDEDRTSRRTSQRQESHALEHRQDHYQLVGPRPKANIRIHAVDRGLEGFGNAQTGRRYGH
jgi:hypothetical protein